MTKIQPSGYNPDVAYGTTPEQALYAVIEQQSAFNTRDPQYIGERPEFMEVKTHDFDLHDWGQYEENRSHVPGTKSDPPYVSTRDTIDIVPENNEVRKRLTIENVWVNVGLWRLGRRRPCRGQVQVLNTDAPKCLGRCR